MINLSDLFSEFLQEQRFRNNSARTLEWYHNNVGMFLSWLGSVDVADLTLCNYKEYCNFLLYTYQSHGKNLKSSSVNSHIRAVKAFYNYCISEDYIEDFSRKLKVPRIDKDEKIPLSDDEISLLLSSFDNSRLSFRNYCWCVLMLDSGLRRGEILNLHIGDVDFKMRCMLVTGKGRKQRLVPIGNLSYDCLSRYIAFFRSSCSASDLLFVDRFGNPCTVNAIKQVFQKLKKQTGIQRLHAHLLRHTFATNYLFDGGDLETLRLILGHSDLQVTMMYLHLAQNKKMLLSKHLSHLDKLKNPDS